MIETELMLDEGQIVLEMHELEFVGQGKIQDPESGKFEKINFEAPINTAQIILTLSEELSAWNSVYPRMNVNAVIFSIDENLIVVNAKGDLPLYKSHGFEEQVKKWFVRELSKREKDFKDLLQQMEINAWKSFPFS